MVFKLGFPVQGLGEGLGLAKGGEEGEMAFMILRLDLRAGCGGLEGRHRGIVDLTKEGVESRAGHRVSEVVVFL